MKKRILSLALSMLMLLSMIPTTAFAEGGVNITVGTVTAEAGDTVAVPVTISGASNAKLANMVLSFEVQDGLSITGATIGDEAKTAGMSISDNSNFTSGILIIKGTSGGSSPDNGTLLTLLVSVAEAATGAMTIKVAPKDNDSGNISDYDENDVNCLFTAGTITVGTTTPPATGYTATLSTSANNNEVVSGSDINVNVAVSHSSDEVFNAGEIKLTYDSSKLSPNITELNNLVTAGTLSGYKVNSNELVIEDFGGDKTMSHTYSIPFTAAEVSTETTDTVTLTRAAFIHKDNASSSDLIEATKSPESLTVTIKVAMVNVTLTNSTDSSETTTTTTQKGVDYTFAPTDTANYTYSKVTATVNGNSVTVTPSADRKSFTIVAADVTGDIALTYTKTANTYNVTWDGAGKDDIKNKPSSATYGQNLTVTLPDDIAPGTEVGYTYGISAQIGETSVGSYDSTTRTLTISGNDITGDIAITVTKTPVDPTDVTITVSGDSGVTIKGVTGNTATVTIGDTVTLVLRKEEGYDYKVVDSQGNEVTFTNGEYTFTASVTETYTVAKTLNVSTVAVTEYVKVDSYVIWLVTFDGTLAEDKIPTYDGSNMFWSDSYDAYCYLVKETTLDAGTAGTKIGAATETATPVDYGMDINGTNVTDAADAQMVWNMYNAEYAEFNTGVEGDKNPTMAQFLAADQNATSENTTWGLNVQDALVIITAILENNATI